MTYTENLWLFFLLLVGIIIVPGMDMLYVLATALTGGRRVGLAATGGLMLGGATHSLYGTLGIGLLTRFLPWLFNPLLIAGALYMAWIGYTLFRSSITVRVDHAGHRPSSMIAFGRGAITCLINPKAYLFMLAVYPQFLKPVYGPIWFQGVIMGLMTIGVQGAIYGTLALAAGKSRQILTANPVATILVGRIAGALLIIVAALGLWHEWRISGI